VKISERERKLVLVLGGLAGIMLLRFLYTASSSPVATASAPAASASRQRGKSAIPEEIVALRIDRLDREPRDIEFGRDPFRYGPVPPPPPPPPPTAAQLRAKAEQEERDRLARIRQAELDAIPKPPPVNLKYLGSFGPEARRVAVFADDGGENLYNARTGDVLEGKFIVDRIGYESVDLKFVGFPDAPAKRLPIGG